MAGIRYACFLPVPSHCAVCYAMKATQVIHRPNADRRHLRCYIRLSVSVMKLSLCQEERSSVSWNKLRNMQKLRLPIRYQNARGEWTSSVHHADSAPWCHRQRTIVIKRRRKCMQHIRYTRRTLQMSRTTGQDSPGNPVYGYSDRLCARSLSNLRRSHHPSKQSLAQLPIFRVCHLGLLLLLVDPKR